MPQHVKMQAVRLTGPVLTVGVLHRLIITKITTKVVKELRPQIFILKIHLELSQELIVDLTNRQQCKLVSVLHKY